MGGLPQTHQGGMEGNKELVRRLVQETVGQRNLVILEEIADGDFAEVAKRWVSRSAARFPTSRWRSWI